MAQKGIHTWEKVLDYHRCPKCGYIIESRVPFELLLGKWKKMEECPRCLDCFTVEKEPVIAFGPLIGDAQPIETEWGK